MKRVLVLLLLPALTLGRDLDLASFRQGKLILAEPIREDEEMLSYECALAGKSYDVAFIEEPDPAPKQPVSWLILFEGKTEVDRQALDLMVHGPGMNPTIACEKSILRLDAISQGSSCLEGHYAWTWSGGKLNRTQGVARDRCSEAVAKARKALKQGDLSSALAAQATDLPARYLDDSLGYNLIALAHRLASRANRKGEKAEAGRIVASTLPLLKNLVGEINDETSGKLKNEILVKQATDLGVYLLESGEPKEAAHLFELVLTKSASRGLTWLGLADARFALGEMEGAKKAYAGYCKRGGKTLAPRARERAPETCGYH